ncbi:response regulator transcription factor [Neobacillus sp. PS3-40]|uniref:response regulator transcription factor n=1 Tax=Neobacillus sp. PS3-40 TaxID=3070679 RepID=UPI0027DFA3E8|nr:response regulator transcription factor [Neobacillus sp. PS3-40]WML46151.1 response regulator transcription factor [Neobacillus sp. PS3-40]
MINLPVTITLLSEQEILLQGLKESLSKYHKEIDVVLLSYKSLFKKEDIRDITIIDIDYLIFSNRTKLHNIILELKRQCPNAPLILYSTYPCHPMSAEKFFSVGVNAIVLKKDPVDKLYSVLSLLSIQNDLVLKEKNTKNSIFDLTEKEIVILQKIADGFKNKDIARLMNLSISSVESYIARIFEKLEVNSRMQAVVKGIYYHFIDIDAVNYQ